MLSQTVEYALDALVYMIETEGPATVEKMAKETGAPPAYLSKIMRGLARTGYVQSKRGVHGGFTAPETLRETSLFDIVHSIDPIPKLPKKGAGPIDRLRDEMAEVLREKTLADLAALV